MSAAGHKTEAAEPVDITDLTTAICRKLGVDPSYVYRLEIDATTGSATVYCYSGAEDSGMGKKHIERDPTSRRWGQPVLEPPLTVRVLP